MKFIAGLRVWRNWGIVENVLKVFLRLRGSANRRVDLHLPLIASISWPAALGQSRGVWGQRTVACGSECKVVDPVLTTGKDRWSELSVRVLTSLWGSANRHPNLHLSRTRVPGQSFHLSQIREQSDRVSALD